MRGPAGRTGSFDQQGLKTWYAAHAPPTRVSVCARAARRVSSPVASSSGQQQGRPYERLKDPAHIGTTCLKRLEVKEDASHSLDEYMRLPVEAYYELDPSMIQPLGGNRFVLKVPRIQLFNVWLEPAVQVLVWQSEPAGTVSIQAVDCKLNGSELIKSMGLDRRFVLRFLTELTWHSPASQAAAARQRGDGEAAPAAAAQLDGSIAANLKLDVWSEVIPPFNLLPREVLQGTGNRVLGGLTSSLLPIFVRKLRSDYERWAGDAQYRAQRAKSAPGGDAGRKEAVKSGM